MSIETGTRLGQYEVQDLIGQGAMGVVYRAYHVQLARTGAVKLMHALTADADTIARFRREAQAIAQMRHPNILNVFDFGEYQGTPYMIVEYVPGGSLANQLRQEPIDRASALRYLRGIAAGLDYAHSLGIVHRDVKPANVLLEKDGTPVIADFGLVKLLQAASVRSMTGATTGTPAYMAPEQVTGSQIGPAADRYSLATIAYEMLTGAIPFEGEGLMEVLYAQVHREPPPPSARVPDLGPRVDAVIMRGLSKDPKARWESCGAFVTALDQALAGAPAPAIDETVVMAPPVTATIPTAPSAPTAVRRATPQAHAAAEATVAIAMPGPERPSGAQAGAPSELGAPRSRKRLFAIAAAALVLLLLLLAIGGYAAISQRPALFLSANAVRPGDALTVSANHLPANQVGEVRLNSPVHTFTFRADSSGNMSIQLTVPGDIGTGSHTVRICWNASCRLQATLHVVDSLAQVTSVAGASPTPGSTPGASPSAKPSASPGASPTSNPTRAPSPTPTSKSTPSSTPPPPPPPRSITLSSSTIKILTGTVTVSGAHFNASQTVTISFNQSPVGTLQTWTVASSGSGTFNKQITVPASAVLGSATIRACDNGGCASQPITVNAT